ncbi:hypothetical protein, partial [Agrobacterium genomosp. 2]|uniref:hypothetical protein n=1 Tax=Agrobacterium genomosp. 2 TaxID=1183409 RepID=UPI001AC005A9
GTSSSSSYVVVVVVVRRTSYGVVVVVVVAEREREERCRISESEPPHPAAADFSRRGEETRGIRSLTLTTLRDGTSSSTFFPIPVTAKA